MRWSMIVCLELVLLAPSSHLLATPRFDSGQAKTPPQGQTIKGLPAQPVPGQAGYYGYPQLPWFAFPTAQKQLNLSLEQMNKLNQVYGDTWKQYSKGMESIGGMPEQERVQKLEQLHNTFNGQMLQAAQGALKPEQLQRFRQLTWQYQGLNAFNDSAVQQQLKLTPDQIRKIGEMRNDQNRTLGEIQKQYSIDPSAAANHFQAQRKQSDEKLNAILTDQQRQIWGQIVGESYDFSPQGLQVQKK